MDAGVKGAVLNQLIVGNWKMNGLEADARAFAAAMRGAETPRRMMVCPPATLVGLLNKLLPIEVWVGGQDCSAEPPGAHTGDVAAEMLKDLGCFAVILGHSERRQAHHETDAIVRAKAARAYRGGLLPLVCVGETEAERDAGRAHEVVARQIAESLPDGFPGFVAYEPIWAIGTGRTPTLADVEAMHRHIRSAMIDRLGEAGHRLSILYGGSVKPENAAALLAVPEVGGALVGGASLDPASFLAIARAAQG